MTEINSTFISLREERFSRLHTIKWWDQKKLSKTKVLVVGAGALGNEVIKNLALLGIGHMVIIDMDRVETSNLCRSVLFRDTDKNLPKAECASRVAKELYPEIEVTPIIGNVLSDVGLGFFYWADVVVGALDNREARLFVNKACAMVGRPWIDGGIDVLNGIVRIFSPPKTACYECTMGKIDWDILDSRRSCSLLARQAELSGHVPTTATTASVIGAIQAQEVVKLIHKMNTLTGEGFVFEGESHNSYKVKYSIKKDCPWHQNPSPIKTVANFNSSTPLKEIAGYIERFFGGLDAIEFIHDIVQSLTCPNCKRERTVLKPVGNVTASQIICEECKSECQPRYFHSLSTKDQLVSRPIGELGLPKWDIIWGRLAESYVGIEIAGDNPFKIVAQSGKN